MRFNGVSIQLSINFGRIIHSYNDLQSQETQRRTVFDAILNFNHLANSATLHTFLFQVLKRSPRSDLQRDRFFTVLLFAYR